ncbi:chromate resistance protein ChrB domain-containing protein [Sinomonas flava]|uniref:chromate resistance protein ChrB domain-containing protein n=1 Tax=Sinomonas flava TaxID=496857 RepID=UPI0039A6CBEF
MKWATRPGVHVDRAACAWLIRRTIDPEALFVYAEGPAAVPADAIPFDMAGVELGHHGPDCSFETILQRYEIHDPVLTAIAELVHEADIEDDRFDAPAAPGLDVIIRGLSLTLDDDAVIAATAPIFDGLYEYFKRGLILGRDPA